MTDSMFRKWKFCQTKQKRREREKENEQECKPSDEKQIIALPSSLSQQTQDIAGMLKQAAIKVVRDGEGIRNIIRSKARRDRNENSRVYKTPCWRCSKSYTGETSGLLRQETQNIKGACGITM